jgi:rod shape-determining protein MreC
LVSQVLLVTDPTFKVGVESQKGHIHGVLNCGSGKCVIEQIQNEDRVDAGEWFYTSGEDRIFPKGFPVGKVISSQPGQGMRDIKLDLSGAPEGVEEVLVVLQGVHRAIPTVPPPDDDLNMSQLPPPPQEGGSAAPVNSKPQTEADKIVQKYSALGQQQGHVYGALGSSIPNFNTKTAPGASAQSAATPAKAVERSKAPPVPAILGARPPSNAATAVTAPVINTPKETSPALSAGPELPLGAPRRRPAEQARPPAIPPAAPQ